MNTSNNNLININTNTNINLIGSHHHKSSKNPTIAYSGLTNLPKNTSIINPLTLID